MKDTIKSRLIEKAKLTLRVSTTAFDEEIGDLLEAAFDTLKTRGVLISEDNIRPMELRAMMTFVRLNFGEPENPTRLKASFDEQLAQLMSTSNYTDWNKQNG